MPKISLYNFLGELPLIPARDLPKENAQTATNLDLNSKTLKSLNTYTSILELTGSDLRSFYRVKSGSDDFWHTSTTEFDACLSPVALLASNEGRYYWTDGVKPKKTNFDLASVSGGTTDGTPDVYYYLEVPPPSQTGITDTKSGTGDGVVYATVTYCVTIITSWGEESIPSSESTAFFGSADIELGEYFTLSAFLSNISLSNAVGFKLYRCNTGTDGSATYQEVTGVNDSGYTYKKFWTWGDGTGTIAITGTAVTGTNTLFTSELTVNEYISCKGHIVRVKTITDNTHIVLYEAPASNVSAGQSYQFAAIVGSVADKVAATDNIWPDSSLGDVIQSVYWDGPEDDLKGLTLLSNNCMAAFKDNEVWISEPNAPFVWPSDYQINVNSNVVGLGHYGSTLVVITETIPCIIETYDPMDASKQYIFEDQAGLWKRGIVSADNFVLFPSKDGIMRISPNGLENITRDIYTKKQWKTLLTTSTAYDKEFFATIYDNKYIAFFKGTQNGFIINLQTFNYSDFSLPATVDVWDTFVDSKDDTLYLLISISTKWYVVSWDSAATFLTYTWKSKKFRYADEVMFSAAQIIGDFTSGVTLKVYGDGAQLGGDITVASNDMFLFGASGTEVTPAFEWEFQLSGTEEVYQAHFATDYDELLG